MDENRISGKNNQQKKVDPLSSLTQERATISNAIQIPQISLPKGGGALKGIDEKFSVNAVNGTSSFSIPLPVSQARGVTPALSLSYNSGAGNGIFGLGWNLSLASIKRKTDKQLPQYLDAFGSDVFLFSEAEDLVPEFKKAIDGSFVKDTNDDYVINEKDSPDSLFTIRFYKPRIEGLFARIERWTKKDGSEIKWRVITKENVTTLFGWSQYSRLADPIDPGKIFEWLPEFIFDDKGNCSKYTYKPDDKTGFNVALVHNKNRLKNNNIIYTNLYPDKVLYCNKTPYKNFYDPFPDDSDFLFETVFDYGTTSDNENPGTIHLWDFRPDAFSEYKSGFEIRTTRLCKRVLLFHHFKGANEYDGLVRSLNFDYDTSTEQDFTFLKSITSNGYIKRTDGSYSSKNLPPFEFEYLKHDWNSEIKTVSQDALIHAPAGIEESPYQFVDLFNEGLSGILTEQASGWYYKHNLGNGNFEQAKLISTKPSCAGLGSQLQLADLDADGGKQLVSYASEPKGFFELDDDNDWQPYRNFGELPNVSFNDPFTRMIDLNGDGKAELVVSEDNVFTWYESEGRNGFKEARKTIKPFDEEAGPAMVFADKKQTIFLADMSGDGLTDIVRIRHSDVCYWPNLGYGKFGAKITMDNSPLLDSEEHFNPSYIKLADIDGSGTTDIIYLGKNKFSCWKNLSGNRFSITPFEITAFPEIHSKSNVTVTDLLGNGVACIVWSSPLAKDARTPLKYIDLMNSKKPHIMVTYKNNMGKEVSLEYMPSTKFYIDDRLDGKPWVTKLHFPVYCVSTITTEDKITGHKFTSSYKYHHGYYDHLEREFRGFGMVEQTDAETFEHWIKSGATNITEADLHQEPVITKQWFHTGAFLRNGKILTQFEHENWYNEMKRQGFPVVHHEKELGEAIIIPAKEIPQSVIDHLSAGEYQQALRACKGMALRSEVFAHDAVKFDNTTTARKKELTPYTVATRNYVIELLQPKGKNNHAVFIVKESEALTYSYERDTVDPRIAHTLNIKLDEYGNVLESASVVYPRRIHDFSLPAETQAAQDKTSIIYTLNKFTNDVFDNDSNRQRLLAEIKTFELKGVDKTEDYYSLSDFENILVNAKSSVALYHEINKPLVTGKAQRRLIEHIKALYYKNDLTTSLPLLALESKAIGFEGYQLAYTPELISDIFKNTTNPLVAVPDALIRDEGKFAHSKDELDNDDTHWWVRSGTIQYIEGGETDTDAQNRFYVPISYTEPFGAKTKVKYYSSYFLFINETEDALGNVAKVKNLEDPTKPGFNFRILSPKWLKDINNNYSVVLTDELGLVKAQAVFGKGNQADDLAGLKEETDSTETALIQSFLNPPVTANGVTDYVTLSNTGRQLLKSATARFVYDFEVYKSSGKPAMVASILRETHTKNESGNSNPVSKLQLSFEYSSGTGQVAMKKVQAEPGNAKRVIVQANNSILVDEIDTSPLLRWIGNGKTILNNKGNAVKQYEPYFSVSNQYEDFKELVESGVTPIMYYDAVGRLVKTEMPDGTFSKLEFDSWKQVVYDANDTVLDSNWYKRRTDNTRPDFITDVKEHSAAAKASLHANTPNQLHFDTLGRPVLSIEHNKDNSTNADELYYTKVDLDIEGNLRSVRDARKLPENGNNGNVVMQYKYDMLGNKVYQLSMDAGQRWLLTNVLGNPLRTWDEKKHEFQYYYDVAHRPTYSKVTGGADALNHIFEKIIYGESLLTGSRTDTNRQNETALQDKNILGQVIRHYDESGLSETAAFDFSGHPKATARNFFKRYQEFANWIDDNLSADLESETFTSITEYDALNRMTRLYNWHRDNNRVAVFEPQYNERGLLRSEGHITGAKKETDGYTGGARVTAISQIEYNEKGQRTRMRYGNGTTTRYHYDSQNFRLIQLRTTTPGSNVKLPQTRSGLSDPNVFQNLYYTYDPAGNITEIEDDAYQPVFFRNQLVEPRSQYTYDALYRLIEASGRENQTFNTAPSHQEPKSLEVNFPVTDQTLRNYTQKYEYDAVGNILWMRHISSTDRWTREYKYHTDSNRLKSSTQGGATINYDYDIHGNMLNYSNSLVENCFQWDYRDMPYTINLEGGGDAFYQYAGSRERSRKRIIRNGGKLEERLYLGGMEVYRRWQGATLEEEIETHHLFADSQRVLIVEDILQTNNANLNTGMLYRYQYSNHLGSVSLEANGDAEIITYEEYHPYGTITYNAKNKGIKSAVKRYRYTGMERDEETGLNYHFARYYLPWLGRWGSCDPIGITESINFYSYVKGRPHNKVDLNGNQSVFTSIMQQRGETHPKTVADSLAVAEAAGRKVGRDYGQHMAASDWLINDFLHGDALEKRIAKGGIDPKIIAEFEKVKKNIKEEGERITNNLPQFEDPYLKNAALSAFQKESGSSYFRAKLNITVTNIALDILAMGLIHALDQAAFKIIQLSAKQIVGPMLRAATLEAAEAAIATGKDVGPVVGGVSDLRTGRSYFYLNDKVKPTRIHPLLEPRIRALEADPQHFSKVGSHAEVYALNDALWARTNAGMNVTEKDLGEFILDTAWLKGKGPRMVPLERAPRCGNCAPTTSGVVNMPGDAPPNPPKKN